MVRKGWDGVGMVATARRPPQAQRRREVDCMTKPKKEMIHPLYLVFSVRPPMGSAAR